MASGDERILCRMLATQFRMGIEASLEDGAFKGVRTPLFLSREGAAGLPAIFCSVSLQKMACNLGPCMVIAGMRHALAASRILG